MILSVTHTPYFNQHKLATKFRYKVTDTIYTLSRYTSTRLEGTLFLICNDTDHIIEQTDENDWELAEPEPADPQLLLTRLLECFHDGDRAEILDALDDISNHIKRMHTLPVINKDYTHPIGRPSIHLYIVPSNEEDINTTTIAQNQDTGEEGRGIQESV